MEQHREGRTLGMQVRYFRRFPPTAMRGHLEREHLLDLDRTAFLMVDVYGPENEIVTDHIAPAMRAARSVGLPVIYAGNSAPRVALDCYEFTVQRDRNAAHYFPNVSAELGVDPREYHYGDGPWGRYAGCVAPKKGDYFVRKIAYSAFHETRLDSLLRHLGVRHLVAVGFSASECLLGTLIDAFNRDYDIVLLRDCTRGGAMTPTEREQDTFTRRMVLWMETYLGYSSTSPQFMEACAKLQPQKDRGK
jgi:nicotinamidase-related amidase